MSGAPASGSPVVGRPATALIFDRNYGPFFAGKVLSSCGMWIQNLAAAVLMWELTESAVMVGAVSALQFAGLALFGFLSGSLSDRADRRKILMVGRTTSGSAVTMLAVLLMVRGVDDFGGAPILLTMVGLMGLGIAISAPSMQAIVRDLVPDGDLEQALALSALGPSIARTVGPAIGAGLLVLGGPALAFGVAAGTHWVFVAAATAIRTRPLRRAKPGSAGVFGGIRYLVDDPKAALLMLGVAALGFGIDPIVTLTPSLSADLGEGSEMVGLFAASFGIGSVVLTGLLRPIRRRMNLRVFGLGGFWILAVGLCVVAAAVTVPVATVGFLIGGAGFMMASVSLNTRIQRRVPDELRGRVMALWSVAFLGFRPVAAIVNGSVADLASVRTALLVAAVITVASSLFARVRYGTPASAPA